MCGGVIVSSASDFVVVWFIMRGVKKSASLYSVYSGTYCAQNENLFSTWFLFVGFYRVSFRRSRILSPTIRERWVLLQRIARFEKCLARRQTVESFSLDEIENKGKKAHDTHSVRTHEIKTDLFSSIILIALGVFRTRGKRLSLWKTWIAICPLCVCMCVCDCFQMYHRYHIKSCCSKSFATFN